jgi:pSer/pThr/pTyr-binding forkhead associated (FHA) protein
MQPIRLPPIPPNPTNPQLIISGHKTYPLREPVITVGRSQDNHIILDDPHISRHHAQIRLRFGQYTLFDADSQSGTYVNDVPVREHRLQSGDVIRLGATSLVYMEDSPQNDHQTGHIDAV